MTRTTWDGQPITDEQPHGASVVVWRDRAAAREWLVLHRRHAGPPDHEGDWAWTPPSGARLPGEPIERCARRELLEETGLALHCLPTECGSEEWAVFAARAPAGAQVVLSAEHDRFLWLPLAAAVERCRPRFVGDSIAAVAGRVSHGR
ncbi:MAG: NUDIX domain-containing protein [Actinomycetota bacterium]|nr:NUDIX domain-containing protein [Actinomycetota bacterium]